MEKILVDKVLRVRLKRMDNSPMDISNKCDPSEVLSIKKELNFESDTEQYEEPITHLSNNLNSDVSLRKSNTAKSQQLINFIDTAGDSDILKAFKDKICKSQNHHSDDLISPTKSHNFRLRKRNVTNSKVTNDISETEDQNNSSKGNTVKIIYDKTGRRVDFFCWKCHRQSIDNNIYCSKCPRCYHKSCLELPLIINVEHWKCPECTPSSEDFIGSLHKNGEVQLIKTLLTTILHGITAIPGIEPLLERSKMEYDHDYSTYVVNPVFIKDIAENLENKKYINSKCFLSDLQWINHNIIIRNPKNQDLRKVGKCFLRITKLKLLEMELCLECYNSKNIFGHSDRVCKRPHLLIWAKLKGYPYWPAKVLAFSKTGRVFIACFGDDHKSVIYASKCFLFSEDYPFGVFPRKQKNFDKAMKEIKNHIGFIKNQFGCFNYAPCLSRFNPFNEIKHLKEMIPTLGDVEPCKISSSTIKNITWSNNYSMDENPESSHTEEYENTLFQDVESKKKRKLEGCAYFNKKKKKISSIEDLNNVYKNALKQRQNKNETDESTFAVKKIHSSRVYTNTKKVLVKNTDSDKIPNTDSDKSPNKSTKNSSNIETGKYGQMIIFADYPASNTNCDIEKNSLPPTTNNCNLVKPISSQIMNNIRQQNSDTKNSNISKSNSQIQNTIQRLKQNNGLCIKRQSSLKDPLPVLKKNTSLPNSPNVVVHSNIPISRITDSLEMHLPMKITKINANHKLPLADNSNAKQNISPLKVLNTEIINSNYESRERNGSRNLVIPKKRPPSLVPKPHDRQNSDPPVHIPSSAGPVHKLIEQSTSELLGVFQKILVNTISSQKLQENPEVMILNLQRQIERSNWEHQQKIIELSKEHDNTINNLIKKHQDEQLSLTTKLKEKYEQEKKVAVDDTKLKQWCANCHQEAQFYCCWNTSYCTVICQESHWKSHVINCTREK